MAAPYDGLLCCRNERGEGVPPSENVPISGCSASTRSSAYSNGHNPSHRALESAQRVRTRHATNAFKRRVSDVSGAPCPKRGSRRLLGETAGTPGDERSQAHQLKSMPRVFCPSLHFPYPFPSLPPPHPPALLIIALPHPLADLPVIFSHPTPHIFRTLS